MANIEKLEGMWHSQGYGHLLGCSHGKFRIHDLTQISCIENKQYEKYSMKGSIEDFFDRFEFDGNYHVSMYEKGGITRYDWDRISSLPEDLIRQSIEKNRDPEFNFEVFWHYFSENYAFFELRKTDWQQIYQKYRPKVKSNTTEDELLNIFAEILQMLGDDHVSLTAGEKVIESARPHAMLRQWQKEFAKDLGYQKLHRAGIKKLTEFVQHDILRNAGKIAANNRVIWGKVVPNIGYLMIVAMSRFAGDDKTLSENLSTLVKVMSQVMEDFKDLDAVIIDERFNPGGYDPVSLLIAGHFIDKKCLAFTKKAVMGNTYTQEQEIYIHPQGDFQFTKPVVYLTSEATISAAEIFTLCMMALPHVTRMGEPTQGVLSDILGKNLPNGWELGLSNEVYTACDGKLYEGRGIPPHIVLPIYDENDFYPHLVTTVEKAVEWLQQKLK